MFHIPVYFILKLKISIDCQLLIFTRLQDVLA